MFTLHCLFFICYFTANALLLCIIQILYYVTHFGNNEWRFNLVAVLTRSVLICSGTGAFNENTHIKIFHEYKKAQKIFLFKI